MVPHNICSESTAVGVGSHHLTLMVRLYTAIVLDDQCKQYGSVYGC